MLRMIDMPQLDLGSYNGLYDILIPGDNFWRQMNETIDFSFVSKEVQKNYSDCMGRTAADPVLLFKYLLLKTARKLSDRDLIERVRYDMEMKYFLAIGLRKLNSLIRACLPNSAEPDSRVPTCWMC